MDGTDARLQAGLAALKADMEANGHGREDPIRTTSALVGDRWSPLILMVLDMGEWRHAELRRALCRVSFEGAISQRVLTLKLRALEREGFVSRHATADVPPKVSYRLTWLGEELVREVRGLVQWAARRKDAIAQARARFDAAD
jgi:DNA-binding HxlR family transcriptional regulator